MCENKLPTSSLSKVIVRQTRPTLYTTRLGGWSKIINWRTTVDIYVYMYSRLLKSTENQRLVNIMPSIRT